MHWWSQVMAKIPVKGNIGKDTSSLKLGSTLYQLAFGCFPTDNFHHCMSANVMSKTWKRVCQSLPVFVLLGTFDCGIIP